MSIKIYLSRIHIVEIDEKTPLCVLEEFAISEGIEYEKNKNTDLCGLKTELVKNIQELTPETQLNTINIEFDDHDKIKMLFTKEQFKMIVMFINPQERWNPTKLLESLQFLLCFYQQSSFAITRAKLWKQYKMDEFLQHTFESYEIHHKEIIGNQTNTHTKKINTCVLYNLCIKFDIHVDVFCEPIDMLNALNLHYMKKIYIKNGLSYFIQDVKHEKKFLIELLYKNIGCKNLYEYQSHFDQKKQQLEHYKEEIASLESHRNLMDDTDLIQKAEIIEKDKQIIDLKQKIEYMEEQNVHYEATLAKYKSEIHKSRKVLLGEIESMIMTNKQELENKKQYDEYVEMIKIEYPSLKDKIQLLTDDMEVKIAFIQKLTNEKEILIAQYNKDMTDMNEFTTEQSNKIDELQDQIQSISEKYEENNKELAYIISIKDGYEELTKQVDEFGSPADLFQEISDLRNKEEETDNVLLTLQENNKSYVEKLLSLQKEYDELYEIKTLYDTLINEHDYVERSLIELKQQLQSIQSTHEIEIKKQERSLQEEKDNSLYEKQQLILHYDTHIYDIMSDKNKIKNNYIKTQSLLEDMYIEMHEKSIHHNHIRMIEENKHNESIQSYKNTFSSFIEKIKQMDIDKHSDLVTYQEDKNTLQSNYMLQSRYLHDELKNQKLISMYELNQYKNLCMNTFIPKVTHKNIHPKSSNGDLTNPQHIHEKQSVYASSIDYEDALKTHFNFHDIRVLQYSLNPTNEIEAILWCFMNYQIDISMSNVPLEEYETLSTISLQYDTTLKIKNAYVPVDSYFATYYNQNSLFFDVTKNYNPIFPFVYYAIYIPSIFEYEHMELDPIGNTDEEKQVWFEEKLTFINNERENFYIGIHVNTTFPDVSILSCEPISLQKNNYISFGCKNKNMMIITIEELYDLLSIKKMLCHPLDNNQMLLPYQIRTLKDILSTLFTKNNDTIIKDKILEMQKMIHMIELVSQKKNSTITAFKKTYDKWNANEKSIAKELFEKIMDVGFYMRGWRVHDENESRLQYPLTLEQTKKGLIHESNTSIEDDPSIYVNYVESHAFEKFYEFETSVDVKRGCDPLRASIYNKIGSLPLVLYKNGKYEVVNDDSKGKNIRTRLSTIAPGYNNNNEETSCMRVGSNYICMSIHYYLLKIYEEYSFDINSFAIIC